MPAKTTMAQKASRRRPRVHQDIADATTPMSLTDAKGKTVHLAVFKDRSFMLKEEADQPGQEPTFRPHSGNKKWIALHQPKNNPDPSPSPHQQRAPQAGNKRFQSLKTFFQALTDNPEETIATEWPHLDATATSQDPYFKDKVMQAAKAIALAHYYPTVIRSPETSLAKAHPATSEPEITAKIEAAATRIRSRHLEQPGFVSPLSEDLDAEFMAAFARYLDSVPAAAAFLAQPPTSRPESPSADTDWTPYTNPFEEHYLSTGEIPPIPKDLAERELWWRFAEQHPEAAGTMYANDTKKNSNSKPRSVTVPQPPNHALTPVPTDAPPPEIPSSIPVHQKPLADLAHALTRLDQDPLANIAIQNITQLITDTKKANAAKALQNLCSLAEERINVLTAHIATAEEGAASPERSALEIWTAAIGTIANAENPPQAEEAPHDAGGDQIEPPDDTEHGPAV